MKPQMALLPKLEFHPLTYDRWRDLERLFGERGACAGCLAISPGSWLAIFHPASDILTDQITEAARQLSKDQVVIAGLAQRRDHPLAKLDPSIIDHIRFNFKQRRGR